MSNPDKTILLVNEFARTLTVVGFEGTIKALAEARNDEGVMLRMACKYIITQVCITYSISKRKLLQGKTKDKRTDALNVCYRLCRDHLSWTLQQISDEFRKDQSRISRGLDRLRNLNPKIKCDVAILEKHVRLDRMMGNYMQELRLNQEK